MIALKHFTYPFHCVQLYETCHAILLKRDLPSFYATIDFKLSTRSFAANLNTKDERNLNLLARVKFIVFMVIEEMLFRSSTVFLHWWKQHALYIFIIHFL